MALPTLHAISGCDTTLWNCKKNRRMTAITKNADLLGGIMEIGNDPINISEMLSKFLTLLVSILYCRYKMDSMKELFCEKGYASEKLPPTSEFLMQHLKRVNYQSSCLQINSFWIYRCRLDGPSTTKDMPAAPEAVLEFVKYGCKTDVVNVIAIRD